ncbi:Hsp20 family protein [Sphingomonas histidinilytica]|nr:Hsp20 family protein [Rhizorhabdus histidinilytica]QEH77960.1 Hsp20 family protein [Sphingomonas sp. C8-2]
MVRRMIRGPLWSTSLDEETDPMRSLDFAPLLRSSIGFENLNRLVDFARGDGDTYPPYNIEKTGDGAYRIQMALAGFTRDEIDVTVQDNVLIIIGRAAEAADTEKREYLHRGIAKRAFERRFQLADTIKVTSAGYENGLLNVELVREIPEHKKPRRIAIDGVEPKAVIDAEPSKAAA